MAQDMTETTTPQKEVSKEEKQIEKIAFNCPLIIYHEIVKGIESGRFGSKTDAVLTALRSYFIK